MGDETDREALAAVLDRADYQWTTRRLEADEPDYRRTVATPLDELADAILASDWLAADRAATRRQALDEAVEAIRAERPSTDVNRLRLSPHHREDELGKLAARRALNDASDVVANLRDGGEE